MLMHGYPQDFSRGGQIHRHSQDFLWRGALFFFKKVELFLVVALKHSPKLLNEPHLLQKL